MSPEQFARLEREFDAALHADYPIANYLAHEAMRVERDLSRIELDKLRKALVACVAVAEAWHGPDVWDIYYNHSPEMKLIREILGPL